MKTSKKLFMLGALSIVGMLGMSSNDTPTIASAEENQLLNGGFEEGLTGWTGDNIGEIKDDGYTFWETRTFNNKGKFLCGEVNESLTGRLVSSSFIIGGEGYVSALIGGNKENYIAVVDDETGTEVLKLRNDAFSDPVPARQWNMIYTYGKVEEEFINKSMHIEIVDTTTAGFGAIVVDEIKVSLKAEDVIKEFYEERDRVSGLNNISATSALDWYDSVVLPFLGSSNNLMANPDFEDGFNGWSYISNEGIKLNENPIREATHYWDEDIPFNNHGQKLFSGWDATNDELLSYGIKSPTFTLGGAGTISFRMGGRNALAKVVLENGLVVTSYRNTEFNGDNFPYVANGNRQGTMITYVADLSNYIGLEMHLEFYDSDLAGNWGVLFVDDIRTYYHITPTVRSLSNMVVQNFDEYSNNAILVPAVKAQDAEPSNLHKFLEKYYEYLNSNAICEVINSESKYNDLMELYNNLSEEEKIIADNRPSLDVMIRDTLNYMENISKFSTNSNSQQMSGLISIENEKSIVAIVTISFVAIIQIAIYVFIKKRKNSSI